MIKPDLKLIALLLFVGLVAFNLGRSWPAVVGLICALLIYEASLYLNTKKDATASKEFQEMRDKVARLEIAIGFNRK